MLRTVLAGLFLFMFVASSQQTAPPGPRRVALVIGNSEYAILPKLPAVKKEAALIAEALRQSGFEVHEFADFKVPDFYTGGEREFADSVHQGDVCFVYYAGYAVQAEDDNYLLPVNFEPQSARDMQERAYHFKRLLQTLESRGAALKIFLLEAPPQLGVLVSGVTETGLMEAPISETKETLIVSAVFPGKWAPPVPEGGIGLLTQAAAKNMLEPGLSLAQVFNKVTQDVGLASGQTQIPDIRSSVVAQQQFFFRPAAAVTPPPAPVITWPRSGIPVPNRTDREEYVWIPPGKFMMGCVPVDKRCRPEEQPQHEVTVSKGFWMGRNEAQVGSYRRYVEAQGKQVRMPPGPTWDSRWRVSDNPVVNVRWDEAAAYCQWAGGRLPTEAEWEYAARGGMRDEIYPMNTENSRDKANFSGKSGNDMFDFVAPVRKFDPNLYALYDMAGNVWEWVNDWFSPAYYAAPAVTDPKGPNEGKEHVIRGGSWDADPREHLRISFRKGFGKSALSVGFRCVIDDTPESRKLLVAPPR